MKLTVAVGARSVSALRWAAPVVLRSEAETVTLTPWWQAASTIGEALATIVVAGFAAVQVRGEFGRDA